MWKCHKCGKPVYFAERKQSLGYDWHPECLRCEECGKRLNPGQHAEHKGVPYCHVPCYGALFGPQLFGHGTRVESHTSFGNVENKSCTQNIPRSHLESKLKIYNQFYDGKSGEIRSREVNGRLVLEGALRIYWGVNAMIHLKEDVDQRTVVTIRKRNNNYRRSENVDNDENPVQEKHDKKIPTRCVKSTGDGNDRYHKENKSQPKSKSSTLPSKLDIEWDEVDDLLQVERCIKLGDKNYQTMPHIPLSSDVHVIANRDSQNDDDLSSENEENKNSCQTGDSTTYHDRKKIETQESNKSTNNSQTKHRGSTAIKRRNKIRSYDRNKLKRRCSINGHFYNRETSFFTPPYGSQMSVWVTSLVSTVEIINLILDKYKVDSKVDNFALFVVRDNGEQRRLADDEYPLLVRVTIGPHEDVAKLYLMDRQSTQEISFDVAQFLNLSMTECSAILRWYDCEEQHELNQINAKYQEMQRRMCQRMNDLKVHL